MTCPVCHRSWERLDAHLAFAHGEVVVMELTSPSLPEAPE